jgi:hypothetical protein
MLKQGMDPESLKELKHNSYGEGLKAFEEFVNNKTRFASKELIISAYEGVLTDHRETEKDILNGHRF